MSGSPAPNAPTHSCMSRDCLLLFARTPQAGRVKSRLIARLTPQQACDLHVAATLDTAELAADALSSELVSKWVFWSEAVVAESLRSQFPSSFRHAVQNQGDLGERMAGGLHRAFESGAARVVILGSDSPHLPAVRIQEAFAAVDIHDLVLGPAEDGGYYLIGCRRFDRGLFDGVAWSTSVALQQTLRNARRLSFTVALLESWYDLDEWKDVERMMQEAARGLPLPRHTANFLDGLGCRPKAQK